MVSFLVLSQISTMTSYPVVDEGEQKQDVLYRDNANSGVIMEENVLQRNAGSSDQRNVTVTLSSFLNLFPAHARVARRSHPCVGKTRVSVVTCDNGESFTQVSCRNASLACTHREVYCDKIYTTCTIKRIPKGFVTGCQCRQ